MIIEVRTNEQRQLAILFRIANHSWIEANLSQIGVAADFGQIHQCLFKPPLWVSEWRGLLNKVQIEISTLWLRGIAGTARAGKGQCEVLVQCGSLKGDTGQTDGAQHMLAHRFRQSAFQHGRIRKGTLGHPEHAFGHAVSGGKFWLVDFVDIAGKETPQ